MDKIFLSGLVLSSLWRICGSTAWEHSVLAWLPRLTSDLPSPRGLARWSWDCDWSWPMPLGWTLTHTARSAPCLRLSKDPPSPCPAITPAPSRLPLGQQPATAAPWREPWCKNIRRFIFNLYIDRCNIYVEHFLYGSMISGNSMELMKWTC